MLWNISIKKNDARYVNNWAIDLPISQLFNQVLTFMIYFVYWITQEVRTYVEGIFDASIPYGSPQNEEESIYQVNELLS